MTNNKSQINGAIMKLNNSLLTMLLCFVLASSFGQNDAVSINGSGFDSIFQNRETGNFSGTVNGILILQDSKNKKTLLDFQGSNAKLDIEKDNDEVYDVSFKKYTGITSSGKTTIYYETYASANSFEIELNGKLYRLSLIDGGCDLIINGLEYTYESEKNAEYLILRITKEIKLTDNKSHKSIILLPKSTLVFAINSNR